LVYNAYRNKYVVSSFPLAYGSYLYNGEMHSHNASLAREILAENGWSEGLTFELKVNENHISRVAVAELIKEQLEKVGITINVQKVDNNTFEEYLENGNYELILTGRMLSLYPNLNSFFGRENLFNYYNEEIIRLLAEINNVRDENLLREKYGRIVEIYNEEMPFISLYFNANILIANNNVRGNLSHNWHNAFYNITTWHRIKNAI